MLIRSIVNGGRAEVDVKSAERLIASGYWVSEEPVKPKTVRKPRTRKTAPVEEPKPEE